MPDGRQITIAAERIREMLVRFEQFATAERGLAIRYLFPPRGSRLARLVAWSGRRSVGYMGARWLAPVIVVGAIACEILAFIVLAFPPGGTLRVAILMLLLIGLAGLCVLVAAALTSAMQRTALTGSPEVFAALEEEVRDIAEGPFGEQGASEEGTGRTSPDR
jgi:hypothetical protein